MTSNTGHFSGHTLVHTFWSGNHLDISTRFSISAKSVAETQDKLHFWKNDNITGSKSHSEVRIIDFRVQLYFFFKKHCINRVKMNLKSFFEFPSVNCFWWTKTIVPRDIRAHCFKLVFDQWEVFSWVSATLLPATCCNFRSLIENTFILVCRAGIFW